MRIACNVDRLYKEKITQVIEKLKEVESGVASEYLNPVAQLEDNRRIRITVAGDTRLEMLQSSHSTLACQTLTILANSESIKFGFLIVGTATHILFMHI